MRQLRRIEPQLLSWAGSQLYIVEKARVRRQLRASQSSFQDVVFTLAARDGGAEAIRLAGDVLLRWKQVQGEEEAYLARLVCQRRRA